MGVLPNKSVGSGGGGGGGGGRGRKKGGGGVGEKAMQRSREAAQPIEVDRWVSFEGFLWRNFLDYSTSIYYVFTVNMELMSLITGLTWKEGMGL